MDVEQPQTSVVSSFCVKRTGADEEDMCVCVVGWWSINKDNVGQSFTDQLSL